MPAVIQRRFGLLRDPASDRCLAAALPYPQSRIPIPASHVPAYASPTPPRSGDVAGTLRLLTYLALSVALIVLDHRGDVLARARAQANLAVQPLWWLAGLPARLGNSVR